MPLTQPIDGFEIVHSNEVNGHPLEQFTLGGQFQPIVSPAHRRVVGYESLARPSFRNQPVSPQHLFEHASRRGTIPELDLQLWDMFLRRYAATRPHAWLFLNLSAQSVCSKITSPRELGHLVRQAGLCTSRIVLEIVEDAVDDQSALMQFVNDCRSEGFRTAIDDFGSGDAHFERIWRLRPDIVKLDRNMVVAAAENMQALQLMLSLIRLIRENGSLVLIEGIETKRQAEVAWRSDADMYQGFWFGKPRDNFDTARRESSMRLDDAHLRFNRRDSEEMDAIRDYLEELRVTLIATAQSFVFGQPFSEATADLLEMEGMQRCYLLDHNGVQTGETVHLEREPDGQAPIFNPLRQARGAAWSDRSYFRSAMERPEVVCLTRPYVGLPDSSLTITASLSTQTPAGHRVICADLHPEEAFPGFDWILPSHL